jgi:nitroreductase
MDALALLQTRSSTSSRLLRAPGPTTEQLRAMLTLAMRVPDHGKLAPWRFVVIQGAARQRLADALVARRKVIEPGVGAEALEKDAGRFLHAPVIVSVISMRTLNHKIPEVEQAASASAVCMQLLNVAHAFGFGAQWLTAWAAYDREIQVTLGLSALEHIAGFIHIGDCEQLASERVRPALSDKLAFF